MPHLTNRETATVLAALRMFQNTPRAGVRDEYAGHFEEWSPLTSKQIDALCERLNLGEKTS